MTSIRVEVKQDHLERLVERASPLGAVAELIWNALDGDASTVDTSVEQNDLQGVQRILVEDDGHGIPHQEALRAFKALGDSEKKRRRHSLTKNRIFHGEKGEGRFTAFAIGSGVQWTTRWHDNGVVRTYTIKGTVDDLGGFEVEDPQPSGQRRTGTEVEVFNVTKTPRSLLGDEVHLRLAEMFAVYLRQYPDVRLRFNGLAVDPQAVQEHVADYPLSGLVTEDGRPVDAELTVIEWKHKVNRELVLCDRGGCTLATRRLERFPAKGFNFTGYLKSDLFRERQGVLDVDELATDLTAIIARATDVLRGHFRKRAADQAHALVEQWKAESVYPYEGAPASPIEQAERQVFDVVALNVNEFLPTFAASDQKAKRFSFQMLRSAIEESPGAIRRIVQEFLELPTERRDELIDLLDRTSLDSMITASRLVLNRLEFLAGLEVVLFEHEAKKKTKERKHLHRLLAQNTWIFGEEFNLSVDDQSLNEVLRKHLKYLGRDPAEGVGTVTTLDGGTGIVDLMLSRQIRMPRVDEFEHLVIELKRPSKIIDEDVIQQVKKYAGAVAKDERFRSCKVRWTFWALSNDMDDYAEMESRQPSRPRGVVWEQVEPRITVWVKTWGEVLDECNGRLRFFKDKLGTMVTHQSGLEHLQRVYSKYLPDILQANGEAAQDDDEDATAGDAQEDEVLEPVT